MRSAVYGSWQECILWPGKVPRPEDGLCHDRYNFADGRSGAEDCDGHGTHVASTATGRAVGVAKEASSVAVRVLDCQGSGTVSNVVAGLNWVAQNAKKPAVVTMSLVSSPTLPAKPPLNTANLDISVPEKNLLRSNKSWRSNMHADLLLALLGSNIQTLKAAVCFSLLCRPHHPMDLDLTRNRSCELRL